MRGTIFNFSPDRSLKYWQTEPRKLWQNRPRLRTKSLHFKFSYGRILRGRKGKNLSSFSSFKGHVQGRLFVLTTYDRYVDGQILKLGETFTEQIFCCFSMSISSCLWHWKSFCLSMIHIKRERKNRPNHKTTKATKPRKCAKIHFVKEC